MRIYTMDDNNQVNLLYKALLSKRHDVQTFNNASDFLYEVSLVLPDLVILDLKLYGQIPGYELAVKLRQISKSVVIIIISSYIDENIIKKFSSLNIYDYMSKPINLNRLDATINEIENINNAYCNLVETKKMNKICILEDTTQLRILYGYQLADFNPDICKSLDEFKKVQDKSDVTTVLLDYNLSEGENFDEVLAYTKKYFSKANIIMISGSISEKKLDRKYKGEIHHFIEKPIESFGMIRDLITKHQVQ